MTAAEQLQSLNPHFPFPNRIDLSLIDYQGQSNGVTCGAQSRYGILCLGKGAKKRKEKKNLTSVSFAFTHTYTPVKTNIFRFFPQAYMENFEKCAKTGNMGTLGGGWGC